MVEKERNNNSVKNKLKTRNETSDRILVSHGTGVYDVTSFAEIHPGGREYLTRFKNKVSCRFPDFQNFVVVASPNYSINLQP